MFEYFLEESPIQRHCFRFFSECFIIITCAPFFLKRFSLFLKIRSFFDLEYLYVLFWKCQMKDFGTFKSCFWGEVFKWRNVLKSNYILKKTKQPIKMKRLWGSKRGITLPNSFVYYSIQFWIGPSFCLELLSIQAVVTAVAKGKAMEVHTSGDHWIKRSPTLGSPPGLQVYTGFSKKSL